MAISRFAWCFCVTTLVWSGTAQAIDTLTAQIPLMKQISKSKDFQTANPDYGY